MPTQHPAPLPSFLTDLTAETAQQLNGGCYGHPAFPQGSYYAYPPSYSAAPEQTSATASFQAAANRLDAALFG